ncbi:hypothetical protein NE237_006320 [Protea cynaroides]|uniref:Reverse transcriptase zinc-binding domain-containing protein n=1 Tax=Protea cynaroides TaxID=273540 RepID=A0A9Q0KMZ3_9MAGN|nr:hypothetical protein NE237_006320 [Protea cynaroides]
MPTNHVMAAAAAAEQRHAIAITATAAAIATAQAAVEVVCLTRPNFTREHYASIVIQTAFKGSAWEEKEKNPKIPWASVAWDGNLLPQHSAFGWCLMLGKLPTDEMISAKGAQLKSRCELRHGDWGDDVSSFCRVWFFQKGVRLLSGMLRVCLVLAFIHL